MQYVAKRIRKHRATTCLGNGVSVTPVVQVLVVAAAELKDHRPACLVERMGNVDVALNAFVATAPIWKKEKTRKQRWKTDSLRF